MTNNPFLKLSPSMEDNDLNVTINAEHEGDESNDEIESLDTSDTPEAAELDAVESGDQVDAIDDASTETEEAVEALENIYVALEQINQTTGVLSASEAKLLQVAVNNATKKIPGLNYETMNMPSMESFESSPYSSLNVAMEGVGDTIKKGVDAVVEFFKKWGNMFLEFIKSMFESYKASLEKAKKFKETIKGIKGYNPSGKMNVPAYSSGWYESSSGFMKHYDALSHISRFAAKYSDELVNIIAEAEKNGGLIDLGKLAQDMKAGLDSLKDTGKDLIGFHLEPVGEDGVGFEVKRDKDDKSDVVVSRPTISEMNTAVDKFIVTLEENLKETQKMTSQRKAAFKRIAMVVEIAKARHNGDGNLWRGYSQGSRFARVLGRLEKTARGALIATTNISLNAYAQAIKDATGEESDSRELAVVN